jgi:hypothetical protein
MVSRLPHPAKAASRWTRPAAGVSSCPLTTWQYRQDPCRDFVNTLTPLVRHPSSGNPFHTLARHSVSRACRDDWSGSRLRAAGGLAAPGMVPGLSGGRLPRPLSGGGRAHWGDAGIEGLSGHQSADESFRCPMTSSRRLACWTVNLRARAQALFVASVLTLH